MALTSPLLPTAALVLVACTTSGCVRGQQASEDPVAPLLLAADQAWADRDRIGLEAAQEPLQEAYGIDPRRPEVLWRLIRHHHAQGWTEPTDRARLFAWAEARSLGITCLATDPEVESARQTRGWVAALELVDDPTVDPCVAWTAMVWSRWLAVLGPGAAAVDLPIARAFADRASDAKEEDLQVLAMWSTALLDATAPAWADGDPTGGLGALEVLIQRHPNALLLHVDRLRFTSAILTPHYRAELVEQLRSARPDTPEERAGVDALLAAEGIAAAPGEASP